MVDPPCGVMLVGDSTHPRPWKHPQLRRTPAAAGSLGRRAEVAALGRSLVDERCRLVAVLGLSGTETTAPAPYFEGLCRRSPRNIPWLREGADAQPLAALQGRTGRVWDVVLSGDGRLPRLVGRSRALEIVFGADDFDADTAAAYGMMIAPSTMHTPGRQWWVIGSANDR